jgi:hypothetical protein
LEKTKGERVMAEGEEMKGSTTTASGATGESVGSKSQRSDDDPDRLGGDIMTRSGDQPGRATGSQEEGEQPPRPAGSADDDDPVRGA